MASKFFTKCACYCWNRLAGLPELEQWHNPLHWTSWQSIFQTAITVDFQNLTQNLSITFLHKICSSAHLTPDGDQHPCKTIGDFLPLLSDLPSRQNPFQPTSSWNKSSTIHHASLLPVPVHSRTLCSQMLDSKSSFLSCAAGFPWLIASLAYLSKSVHLPLSGLMPLPSPWSSWLTCFCGLFVCQLIIWNLRSWREEFVCLIPALFQVPAIEPGML